VQILSYKWLSSIDITPRLQSLKWSCDNPFSLPALPSSSESVAKPGV